MKTKSQLIELQKKTAKQLLEDIKEMQKEKSNLLFGIHFGRENNTAKVAKIRKNIAKAKTLLTQKIKEHSDA